MAFFPPPLLIREKSSVALATTVKDGRWLPSCPFAQNIHPEAEAAEGVVWAAQLTGQ